eukprot:EC692143.1.p1 GENE.EC692143.1~~EC692143.1.p1  ORF type:complete len:216 (+),score=56.67 EC692143.1:70-648(+)
MFEALSKEEHKQQEIMDRKFAQHDQNVGRTLEELDNRLNVVTSVDQKSLLSSVQHLVEEAAIKPEILQEQMQQHVQPLLQKCDQLERELLQLQHGMQSHTSDSQSVTPQLVQSLVQEAHQPLSALQRSLEQKFEDLQDHVSTVLASRQTSVLPDATHPTLPAHSAEGVEQINAGVQQQVRTHVERVEKWCVT